MHITDLVIWSITCFFIPDMHIYYITFWVLDPSQGFRVAQADPARSIQTSVFWKHFCDPLVKMEVLRVGLFCPGNLSGDDCSRLGRPSIR